MTKYLKIKSDTNTQTFLYALEGKKKKNYIVFKKAIHPWEKNVYYSFTDLQEANSKFDLLIS
jgi:hypothetical protein